MAVPRRRNSVFEYQLDDPTHLCFKLLKLSDFITQLMTTGFLQLHIITIVIFIDNSKLSLLKIIMKSNKQK